MSGRVQNNIHRSEDDNPPASKLLSRRRVKVDSSTGESSISYQAERAFCNRHGTVQGGFLAAMLDSATALTLLDQLPKGSTAVTRRLDTQFLKPAQTGTYIAYARVVSTDRDNATVTAELKSPEGTVVATAKAELRIFSAK